MAWLTPLFLIALVAGTLIELWLSGRQMASRHRSTASRCRRRFADSVSAQEHRKAADYTIAKVRFGRIGTVVDAAAALALTVGGGIAAIDALWRTARSRQPWLGLAVIATRGPRRSSWSTCRSRSGAPSGLEARFGFNRITPACSWPILRKSLALAAAARRPAAARHAAAHGARGPAWWLWAWVLWLGVMLVMAWAWPAFIAPLFNRFSPLKDQSLRERIESLLRAAALPPRAYSWSTTRAARATAMPTSPASAATSASCSSTPCWSGWRTRRVEAVLAHELGHFRLKHVRKRLLRSIAASLAGLALLGWLAAPARFLPALGVPLPSTHAALLLFLLAVPAFIFFLTPLASLWSRRHEFEADDFATPHASAAELATALVKLHRDNASTLTPDPVYAAFYYSHPPPLMRITRLRAARRRPRPGS